MKSAADCRVDRTAVLSDRLGIRFPWPPPAPGPGRPDPAPVWHVSAMPVDFSGRDAIAAALDLVAHELAPLVATFFTVTPAGLAQLRVVHGSHLPPAALVREARGWQA